MQKLCAVVVASCLLAALVVHGQDQGKGKGGAKGPPKNLKVLTPDNLIAQMQTYPVALGVENQGGCNYCHEADRSLDTKPTKVKARQMIEMVAAINTKFGDDKTHVTCWTCHQGSTKPETARIPK